MRVALPLALAVGVTLLGAPAASQPDPGRGETVLHEYIPDEADAKALIDFAAKTGAGRLPPGFTQDGELLKRPEDGLTPRPKERTIQRTDRNTQRDREARPDRDTRHEGQLHYRAVFNPSVVPFKRVNALDAVNDGFVLYNRRPGNATLRLKAFSGDPTRALFWGSVLLRGRRGETLPLPSVAPDMEIHGFQTVPAGVGMTFRKDGADNFAVTLGRGGRVRLRFLVSAPNRYFSHAVPPHLTLADVPPERRPVVPAAVRAVARRMHTRLGLDPSAPLVTLIDRLVAHFRAFEEGPLAVSTGNTYEDLTVSQRGVCRHRSYAFVITSLALGLPARYVTNEAHAFVEVWVPRVGWLRIDLGGAANELNVSGAERRAVHQPVEDPFPKPPAYSQNYSRLNGAVNGLTPRQRRGPKPRTGHGATRRLDPGGTRPVPDPAGPRPAPGPSAPAAQPVTLQVATAVTTGLRGAPLTIRGQLRQGGSDTPLGGRSVELLLRQPGSKDLVILGETVSAPDGSFELQTTVPLGAAVGRYHVVAYSPADAKYQAGWSN